MPLSPSLPLILSLVLLAVGLYLGAGRHDGTSVQRSVTASVNRCFLAARLTTLARICAVIFVPLLFVDILTALGFAIGAFANGFLALRFPQHSYRYSDPAGGEPADEDTISPRFAAGIVTAALAVLTVGGYQTLLALMTPSGQAIDPRPLWGLGLGSLLAAWLMRIRPATHWLARRLSGHFPAHCRGQEVHPLVWFELLCLALVLLATRHDEAFAMWAAAWLIIAFTVAALLVRRLLADQNNARDEAQVVFTLLLGASLFLAARALYLPADMANPWREVLAPVVAGIFLLWLLLLVAGNERRYAGRLSVLSLVLLALFLVYGRRLFGDPGLLWFLPALLSATPIMFYLGENSRLLGDASERQSLLALRFTHLVVAAAMLILAALLARARYLGLGDQHDTFYDALLPAGLALLALGVIAGRWLRARDVHLLLHWSELQPATPINRHSREWPELVRLGRRHTLDRLLPLGVVALLPPVLQLAGRPGWALAAVVTVMLILTPRLLGDALRYHPAQAREPWLFELCLLALVILFVLDPLPAGAPV